jgi:hypothetical protein
MDVYLNRGKTAPNEYTHDLAIKGILPHEALTLDPKMLPLMKNQWTINIFVHGLIERENKTLTGTI